MNRQIKFRAWDGEKMRYDFLVARPQACDVLMIMTDEHFAKENYGLKKWKVMQYTGVNDCKGNDIWEGDIVQCAPLVKLYRQVIFFEGNYYLIADGDRMVFEIQVVNTSHTETIVVGNIYENSDLLK